eukprot:5626212-Alexandrium_andersonii.AAC.1
MSWWVAVESGRWAAVEVVCSVDVGRGWNCGIGSVVVGGLMVIVGGVEGRVVSVGVEWSWSVELRRCVGE